MIYYTDNQHLFFETYNPSCWVFVRWMLTAVAFLMRLLWEFQLCRGSSALRAPTAHYRVVQESAANRPWAAVLWLRYYAPQLPKRVIWTVWIWVFCFFWWSLEGVWLTCYVHLQKLLDNLEEIRNHQEDQVLDCEKGFKSRFRLCLQVRANEV